MKISVPIRRINILEKTDSIPRIESFFRLFFQSGRNFSDLPSIFFYIHISCHRDFSSNRIIRHVTMGERRMLFTSRLDGKRNRGTRVGSEISRSQMKRACPVTPCDLNLRFRRLEPIYIIHRARITDGRRFRLHVS